MKTEEYKSIEDLLDRFLRGSDLERGGASVV